jgi:hypothetical protein
MTPLSLSNISRLDELLMDGMTFPVAFADAVGATSLCEGFWRFFSNSWPDGGASVWNTTSPWKTVWQPFLPAGLFCFGEDLFGNQIVLRSGHENVWLWNHENSDLHDLFVGPSELLKTAIESGINWIDFYSNGYLNTALRHGTVSPDQHLHWTTPLILGGSIQLNNVSVVERVPHLVGHARLWSQIH